MNTASPHFNFTMAIKSTSFIHFNDIYKADRAPPFATSIKKSRKALQDSGRHVFTFFSGDVFSPSIMSTIFRGEHMIPVLNALNIDAACLGNHELDFGLQEFRELRDQCNFPWLCSNAWDVTCDEPLGGCKEYVIIDKTGEGGSKLLVIGLVEQGWLDTLSSVDPGDVVFEPPSDFVQRRIPELEKEFGTFDAIVAVTHMTMPHDKALAENGGIDIILGGHDHHYEDVVVNGIRVLNSGADFKCYTVIDVEGGNSPGGLETNSRRVDVTSDDEPDQEVAEGIKKFQDMVDESMGKVVGRTKVPLDARFSEVRMKETNISNFIAELMTRATGADVAILNAGSIRADRIIEKGELTLRDLCELLPMEDENMVISLSGEKLVKALENGVSQYPAMEGRFPCVDGIRFIFDPRKPPGSRVEPGSVYIRSHPLVRQRHTLLRGKAPQAHAIPENEPILESLSEETEETNNVGERKKRFTFDYTGVNEHQIDFTKLDLHEPSNQNGESKEFIPIDPHRMYSVVSNAYLLSGKEGFESFIGAPVLRHTDECPLLPTMLRNIFTELRSLRFWSGMTVQGTVVKAATKFKRFARRSVADPFAINPVVDGRIVNIEESETKP